MTTTADQLTLVRTCTACPEQYDVLDRVSGETVGYVRLRHGDFRVDAEPSGETLFERSFDGHDGRTEPEEDDLPKHSSDGIFDTEEVRAAYLAIALRKVAEYRNAPAAG